MGWVEELFATASEHPFTTSMVIGGFLVAWLGGRYALQEDGLSNRTLWPVGACVSVLLGAYAYVVGRAFDEGWAGPFIVQGATLLGFWWAARPRRTAKARPSRALPVWPAGTGPASRAFQTRK
jgi:hypothetical protein